MSGRFLIVGHTLHAQVEKSEKQGFLVENSQQILCNSGIESLIDPGNGALGARDRAGEDAVLCDCAGTTAVCFLGTEWNFGQKSLF